MEPPPATELVADLVGVANTVVSEGQRWIATGLVWGPVAEAEVLEARGLPGRLLVPRWRV